MIFSKSIAWIIQDMTSKGYTITESTRPYARINEFNIFGVTITIRRDYVGKCYQASPVFTAVWITEEDLRNLYRTLFVLKKTGKVTP